MSTNGVPPLVKRPGMLRLLNMLLKIVEMLS
jgi:hypothetical protein